ncbi:MAG: hypothetical protein KJ674_00470 [Nanoarchaeota archaeon]|nr:hypothetical protein [Nanoarchaeota archaeon]
MKKIKKITLGFILSWIFGILFLFTGMGVIGQGSVVYGILIILFSAMIIPYFNKIASEKLHFEISGGIKFALVILIIICIGLSISASNSKSSNSDSTQKEMNEVTQKAQTTEQEIQTTSVIEPENSPLEIAEDWAKALIKGSGSEDVFNYLPQEIKSKYSSYDSWNDELYNIKHAWNMQGLYFTFIEVKNETIQGDNASVEVKYQGKGIVQSTVTKIYEFIKEDGEWKLKEYYGLTI